MTSQGSRPRPSQALLDALRAGKATLRQQRQNMDLREKVRIVLEMQRLLLPLIQRHRQLQPWERPWDIVP
jgi:hypothetical protein